MIILCQFSQLVAILTSVFVIYVLIVCAKSKINNKILWILFILFGLIGFYGQVTSDPATRIIIFIPLGAIIFMAKRKKIVLPKPEAPSEPLQG